MDVERAVELYAAGMTMPMIAAELDVATSTVWRALDKAGVQSRRSPLKMPGVADIEIVRLRQEGKLWREVAAEVRMSRNGVAARWRTMQDR